MSVVTVVRHGQASFLAENYDKLSALGEQQAELLAAWWIERGVAIDQVYYGPRERQIRTGEIVGSRLRAAGLHWPEPTVDDDLDEFPAEDVARTYLPILMARHADLAAEVARFQTATDFSEKQRSFDKMLREVCDRWVRGEVSDPSIPTWQDFCHRIESAVGRIRAGAPKSGHVAVFTSGGPTAATTRVALGLDYAATMNLTWSPRNASFSEFLSSPGRFTLSTFNNTPHLRDAAFLTYR